MEVVLAAPRTLRTVQITVTHVGRYDLATSDLLAGSSNWSRLDDALCELEKAEIVCVIAGDFSVVHSRPAHRIFDMSSLEMPTVASDERIPLLLRMLPRVQASGRLKFGLLSMG